MTFRQWIKGVLSAYERYMGREWVQRFGDRLINPDVARPYFERGVSPEAFHAAETCYWHE